jgi:5-methylcytosine-specific restriction endonuclease McrA
VALRDAVYGATWRKLRLAVLERDGYTCRIGLPGCLVTATQVDHVVSWRDGGSVFDESNLRAACGHCNAARGGAAGAAKSLARFSERRPSREW